jgi:replication fork clamp-binding protein CrfC
MRDLRKDMEGVFKNREQAENAIRLLKLISDRKESISQMKAVELLELNEMAISRLARELKEHGYIKRSTRTRDTLEFDKDLRQHVESWVTEKMMHIKLP